MLSVQRLLQPLDPGEPERVAQSAEEMGLRHVVITSVNRDELPDGGASHIRQTIDAVRAKMPAVDIEVLTPIFAVTLAAVSVVVEGDLSVFNHNIETVLACMLVFALEHDMIGPQRLATCCPRASGPKVKSGFMVGLGEARTKCR